MLEREVADLQANTDREGFYSYRIGGDPDPDQGGFYEWDPDREEYRNGSGHTLPADEAPDSEFDFTITYE